MKYNALALLMSNCDEIGGRFLIKVEDKFKQQPTKIYPAIYEYSVTVLNKAPHNEVFINAWKCNYTYTEINHFMNLQHSYVQAALPTRNILCYLSDPRLSARHTG
jgi:hypothetical protein